MTLERAGYHVERWDGTLAELADHADARVLLILANPYPVEPDAARAALENLLRRQGRILATGSSSLALLPGAPAHGAERRPEECALIPIGFDQASIAAHVRMRPAVFWRGSEPRWQVQYTCDDKPAVVTYSWGSGTVEWWADAWPLQNQGITQADNLQLLLAALGPPAETHIYWDESLHGAVPSLWSHASGTPFFLGLAQVVFTAALLLFSYSRRSGPLRPDPVVSRASAIEFVTSMGGLFHKAHASDAAVAVSYQQVRRFLHSRYTIPIAYSVEQAMRALEKRTGSSHALLERDLQEADRVANGQSIREHRALALLQSLYQHQRELSA